APRDHRFFGVHDRDALAVECAFGHLTRHPPEDTVPFVDHGLGVEFGTVHRITRTFDPSGLSAIASSSAIGSPTCSIFVSAVPEKSIAATVMDFWSTPLP